jgi:ubiquinone/menaquinone biosynthesis C-methylase UbiE
MEQSVYEVEARVEAEHWWFRGRRLLFAEELHELKIGKAARALDVGTGTGSNLRMLREQGYENITGVDLNELAARYCSAKGFTSILVGDANRLPFAESGFDLILATDTIEHVEDDQEPLGEIHRLLAPGGYAVVVVPAFPSLWGLQDVVAQHKRRYRMDDLRKKIQASGLTVRKAYHFNYMLFVPIWLARKMIKIFKIKLASESDLNPPSLNRLLCWIFAFDVRTAPLLRPPFGVSIMVIAQKSRGVGF